MRTIELAQAAAAKGLLFPPDPGSQTTATVGGNVAECSGGLRALKYGVMRDYVLGVEAVLPTGEIIRSGGRLVKDVAGYDLRRLLCGSEGTLAVMTELTLRLVPAPEASGVGMAYFRDLADAARAVSRVLASGVLPVTLEFLDQVCIGAVEDYAQIGLDTSAGALLIFAQDGDPACDRARPAADGARLRGGGRDGGADRRVPGGGRRGARGAPCRAAVAVAPGAAHHPRGRDGAAVAHRRDGRVHPGGRPAPRAQDRHVRPRWRRQPASDRGP